MLQELRKGRGKAQNRFSSLQGARQVTVKSPWAAAAGTGVVRKSGSSTSGQLLLVRAAHGPSRPAPRCCGDGHRSRLPCVQSAISAVSRVRGSSSQPHTHVAQHRRPHGNAGALSKPWTRREARSSALWLGPGSSPPGRKRDAGSGPSWPRARRPQGPEDTALTTCRTQASAQTALARQQVAQDHLPAPQSPSVSVTTYVTGLW